MKTIYKYRLNITDFQTIEMPYGAQILHVETQFNTPCIWAIVDTSETRMVPRTIVTVGTGNPMPDEAQSYIGTYLWDSGKLVMHLFEKIN